MEIRHQTPLKPLVAFRGSGEHLFLKQKLPMAGMRVIKPKKTGLGFDTSVLIVFCGNSWSMNKSSTFSYLTHPQLCEQQLVRHLAN